MITKRRTKFLHEGQYAAAVEIEYIESETGWSPCLSLEDAEKLDQVRDALRMGDLKSASRIAKVYQLTLLTSEMGYAMGRGGRSRQHPFTAS
jgi:hypothetical protein